MLRAVADVEWACAAPPEARDEAVEVPQHAVSAYTESDAGPDCVVGGVVLLPGIARFDHLTLAR
ncbi:hypothetical protein GCM10017779_67720 [Streptomyces capillispiralis]|uniref:Uncharacterized protein n=1 Tax=Streptomyces capillispiralis TaxID=68182 RepID=A0A561SGJ4_9ACTN|nr:hypothetical protein FHX78_1227 [Streptomyces capillispiralis]GHH96315.1 hypothetical protein GCM10017779_67720 [Streptomyces capillispiralis]